MTIKTPRFIIWVLNNDTNTKQRVVEGRKNVFTRAERDRIVGKLIKMGHGAEVEPA